LEESKCKDFVLQFLQTSRKGVETVGAFTKRWVIDRRRARRQKINLLRRRYKATKSEAERNALIKKAQQVSQQMSADQFIGPIQPETKA
jgi:Trm5-related predicted tRNA methylase